MASTGCRSPRRHPATWPASPSCRSSRPAVWRPWLVAAEGVAIQQVDRPFLADHHEWVGSRRSRCPREAVREDQGRARPDIEVAVAQPLGVTWGEEIDRLQASGGEDPQADGGLAERRWRRRTGRGCWGHDAVAADQQDLARLVRHKPPAGLPDPTARFAELGWGRRDERLVRPSGG